MFRLLKNAGARAIVIVGNGKGNLSDHLLRHPATFGDKILLVRRSRTGSGSLSPGRFVMQDREKTSGQKMPY